MLRLNPGDNQGVRYILLNWLLAEPDRRNDVSKLLKKYDDASAEWLRSVAEGLHQGGNRGRRTSPAPSVGDRLKVYSDPCFPPGLRERIGTTERVPLRSPALEDAGDPRLDIRVQDAVPKLLLGRPGVGKEREREGEASNRHLQHRRAVLVTCDPVES